MGGNQHDGGGNQHSPTNCRILVLCELPLSRRPASDILARAALKMATIFYVSGFLLIFYVCLFLSYFNVS
jgi:hypothetical protein